MANTCKRFKLASAFLLVSSSLLIAPAYAIDSITGIEGDYGGFWSSSESNISAVVPDSTNNLVAFTTGGVRYSTGVADASLDANALSYQADSFRALNPIGFISGYAGQGSNIDGNKTVGTGLIYPVTGGDVTEYMTDGIRGLDLSTFGNNVAATVNFNLSDINLIANTDAVPEFLYFNMAWPNGSLVRFRLYDEFDNQLGSTVSSAENAHPNIADVENDRFRTSNGNSTGTASVQQVQGFGVGFSDFGVTATELASATRLELELPAQADPPFIAYRSSVMTACAIYDSDGDGICDLDEGFDSGNPGGSVDSDGDGIDDYQDADSDGDGSPDSIDTSPNVATVANDSGDSGVAIDVLANDDYLVDGDSNNAGVTTLTAGAGGTCLGTSDFDATSGTLLYTPSIGDYGKSSCTVAYEVCNNESGSLVCETATATIALIIDSDNDGIVDNIDLDDDNDGIPDSVEGTVDTDGDGIPDSRDLDSDNDGISDLSESGLSAAVVAILDDDNNGQVDINNDVGANGLANAVETADDSASLDYDGDGAVDTNLDTDLDGVADYRDLDKDNDGIPDLLESGLSTQDIALYDQDGNGAIDPPSQTSANVVGSDGILDLVQGDNDGESLTVVPADTDGDGVIDSLDLDSDNDGIPDLLESGLSLADITILDSDSDGQIDPPNQTTANVVGLDGLVDSAQGNIDGNPVDTSLLDSDGDTVQDYRDLDSDNDGLLDITESGQTDADGDGFVDGLEEGVQPVFVNASSIIDSDGDNIPDNREVDSDNDGVFDIAEPGVAAELTALDTDSDGVIDGASDPANDPDKDGVYGAADVNPSVYGTPDVLTPSTGDSDGDGISDVDEQNGDANRDTDGDGVLDYLDKDSDNDGFLDSVEENADCVHRDGSDAVDDGDCDDDGIQDRLQNNELSTAVTGVGSASWPLLFILTLVVSVRLFARRTVVAKTIFASLALLLGSNVHAHDNYSARYVMPDDNHEWVAHDNETHGSKGEAAVQAELEFHPSYYLGFGLGRTYVDPEGRSNGFETDDSDSEGVRVVFGRHFKPHWAWELTYADLGAAGLGNPTNNTLNTLVPDAEIDYKVPAVWLRYAPFDPSRNLTADVKVGIAALSNSASDGRIGYEKQTTAQLAFGLGAQLRFAQRYLFRVDFESYDRDANFTALTLGAYLKGHDSHGSSVNYEGSSTECYADERVYVVVEFQSNSAYLGLSAQMMIKGLMNNPQFELDAIHGHADYQGPNRDNKGLSEQRAQAIKSFLEFQGLDTAEISVLDFGDIKPLADSNAAVGRVENRRAELHGNWRGDACI